MRNDSRLKRKRQKKPVLDRVWPRVRKTKTCWVWVGTKHHGYGRMLVGKKLTYVHRIMAMEFLPGFREDLDVLHRCDQPSCVNPKHLFLGTQADNVRDMFRKGRAALQTGTNHQMTKVRCPKGHSYLGANLFYNKKGDRLCRECSRAWARKYHQRLLSQRTPQES